jgi:hypothetical protein
LVEAFNPEPPSRLMMSPNSFWTRFELRELFLIGIEREAFLLPGLVGRLHLLESPLLGLVVAGPDVRSPLEGHVLEHVSQAGDARHLLRGAHVDQRREGEDRGHRPLRDDEGPAVLEDVDRGLLLEGGQVLGRNKGCAQEQGGGARQRHEAPSRHGQDSKCHQHHLGKVVRAAAHRPSSRTGHREDPRKQFLEIHPRSFLASGHGSVRPL